MADADLAWRGLPAELTDMGVKVVRRPGIAAYSLIPIALSEGAYEGFDAGRPSSGLGCVLPGSLKPAFQSGGSRGFVLGLRPGKTV